MRRLSLIVVALLCLSSYFLWDILLPNQPLTAVASVANQSSSDSPNASATAEPEEEPADESDEDESNEDESDENFDQSDESAESDEDDKEMPESDRAYQIVTDEFFTLLGEDGGTEALENLFSYNSYIGRVSDQVSMLTNQFESAERIIGSYMGHELLIETRLADRVVHQQYLVLYERQPLYFDFIYYKANDEWTFQNFEFSSDVIEEIKQMSDLALMGGEQVTFHPPLSTE